MTRVTLGRSRVRESRMPGSVRAKAEWLSYSTTTANGYRLSENVDITLLGKCRSAAFLFVKLPCKSVSFR
ncbi:hypothetical protein SAMN05216525_15216 [Bradyrhizobium sp. Gha]|nr:hypothetical protein SAMN05216525_15216 [Bradyrhizobium sp. Gha]